MSGSELARETWVSLRTLYRDIATLQGMGAHIEGEAGVGYILRPSFLLPPMSFTEEELQAIVVGAQWVSRQTDDALALAAQNAVAKIGAVLPPEMRRALDDNALYVARKEASVLKTRFPDVRIALHDNNNAKVVLVSPDTVWVSSADFGKTTRIESAVGLHSSAVFKKIQESLFHKV